MSRGKISRRALDAAVVVARGRGQVIFLKEYPGSVCDFLILTPYGIVAVCVRKSRRIRSGIDEIAYEYHGTLNLIRASDHCPGVVCEFWLWSPYGTMRFFELDGLRLTELTLHGLPLVPPVTGKPAGNPDDSARKPEKNPAGGPAGQTNFPGKIPANLPAGQKYSPAKNFPEKIPAAAGDGKSPAGIPAAPVPGPQEVREPHYIRYLRHRNREIQRKKEEAAAAGKVPAAGAPPGPGDPGSPT